MLPIWPCSFRMLLHTAARGGLTNWKPNNNNNVSLMNMQCNAYLYAMLSPRQSFSRLQRPKGSSSGPQEKCHTAVCVSVDMLSSLPAAACQSQGRVGWGAGGTPGSGSALTSGSKSLLGSDNDHGQSPTVHEVPAGPLPHVAAEPLPRAKQQGGCLQTTSGQTAQTAWADQSSIASEVHTRTK